MGVRKPGRRGAALGQIGLTALFVLLGLIALYPLWHCIAGSITTYNEYIRKTLLLWPQAPTLEAYRHIFSQGQVFSPMRVTIFITVAGTAVNMTLTTLAAYGLSKPFPGRTAVTVLFVLTMFISPGLIPNYMLLRNLNLLNRTAVYIVPNMVNTFYLILMRTQFAAFPGELEDAAHIDGASPLGVFLRVLLPLSRPILATVGLFTAVDYWNTFANSVYFVTDPDKKTLQDLLYRVLNGTSMNMSGTGMTIIVGESGDTIFGDTIKLAYTVIAVIPILFVYPFMQKHLSSGLMMGALKG